MKSEAEIREKLRKVVIDLDDESMGGEAYTDNQNWVEFLEWVLE
jgi:hypothetical protein